MRPRTFSPPTTRTRIVEPRWLQEDAVGATSVWGEVEYRALIENPNVTSITGLAPRTGVETLLSSPKSRARLSTCSPTIMRSHSSNS
jgi:hypothetical protein